MPHGIYQQYGILLWGDFMFKLVLFLLVLNFDAFITGLALGVAGISVKPTAGAMVAVVSAAFFAVALWLGNGLLLFLPVDLLHKLGLLLLGILTLLWIVKFCRQKNGHMAGVWRAPRALDANADKYLSMPEAALLALALALDSLGGGLAFGLLGQNALLWGGAAALLGYVMFMGANLLGKDLRCVVKS